MKKGSRSRGKKKKKPPISKARKVGIFCAAAGSLGLAIAIALYFYTNRIVSQRLRDRTGNRSAMVYGDTVTLTARQLSNPERARAVLTKFNYEETRSKPKNPGEFLADRQGITVLTREFVDPGGNLHPSETREITFGESGRNDLVLEPQPLAPLSGGEQRLSHSIHLNEVPKHLVQAVLSIEDQRFYRHMGVDLIGIARALATNIRAMRIVQGGSTVTQQLAKNLLFSPERSLGRKVLEAMAALSIEQKYTKDQILELYLNEVYLGQEGATAIHGVGAAIDTFFNKKVEEVTIAESALLAGMIRAPSYYSPRRHKDRALKRRDVVLHEMREKQLITESDYKKALMTKIKVENSVRTRRTAPFYIEQVKRELQEHLNVDAAEASGVKIYTGLSSQMQLCAEESLREGLNRLEQQYPRLESEKHALEGGLVAIEPFSGLVRAWVGGRDYSEGQYDHVTQAKRQVGSTIKPFVYLTALDGSLNSYKPATPISLLPDRPLEVELPNRKLWRPENYDHKYRDEVTLRYALEQSLNVPSAYLGQRVGVQAVARTLSSFGLADNVPEVPSITLGTLDTTLFRLTTAYASIANGGIYITPRVFLSVIEADSEPLARSTFSERRVADERPVYVLTNIMQGVIERGTGKAIRQLGFSSEAAGKTGTSNDARDAWFVGFTPALVAGIWIGFDDNSPINITGGGGAAPIWANFMKCAEPFYRDLTFIPPPGIETVSIDSVSGQLATDQCPSAYITKEVFVSGTEPIRPCETHSGGGEVESDDRPRSDGKARPHRRKSMWEIIFGE